METGSGEGSHDMFLWKYGKLSLNYPCYLLLSGAWQNNFSNYSNVTNVIYGDADRLYEPLTNVLSFTNGMLF